MQGASPPDRERGVPLGVNLRGAGVSLPGFGVSPSFFFPLAACGSEQKEKKRCFGDTLLPAPQAGCPAKGRQPLGTPPEIR